MSVKLLDDTCKILLDKTSEIYEGVQFMLGLCLESLNYYRKILYY